MLGIAAMRNREWPGLPAGALKRGVLAGAAWGVVMGIGLPVLTFLGCGTICLSDVAITTVISVAAGIGTLGPLAAVGRRAYGDGPVRQPA